MGFFGCFSTIARVAAAASLLFVVVPGLRAARARATSPALPDNVIVFPRPGLTPRERRVAQAHALDAPSAGEYRGGFGYRKGRPCED